MQEITNSVKLLVQFSIFILPFFLVFSCKEEPAAPRKFSIPVLYNSENLDSIPEYDSTPNYVQNADPIMIGKYSFCDSIDLNKEKWAYPKEDLIPLKNGIPIRENFDVNGFEIIVDYENTNHLCLYDNKKRNFYPIYIVNPSDTNKYFYGKNGSPFSIQEAIDTNYIWRPIEHGPIWSWGCDQEWWLKVRPQEFILILIPKYMGEFETKLRVRFKLKDNIMVSQHFKGAIKMDQFKVKDGSNLENELYKSREWNRDILFYDGNPPPNSEWETTTYGKK